MAAMLPGSRSSLAVLAVLAVAVGCAPLSARRAPDRAPRQFTFAWPFRAGDDAAPRGGTTEGAPVTLDGEPGAAWRALQAPGLTKRERDRRAILAMAGTFRTSFDFLEVIGFRPGFVPDRPYQSWATEYVYVLRDEPRFVSLQHLLVMYLRAEDGRIEGPFVTKHWRQDWRWENTELLTYRGRNTWARTRLTPAQAKGTWTQAVYQVDDSPRYAAYGRWEHFGNASTWKSSTTWRPLPRREFSVRHDYDVLIGTNRHTITPTGWVQEEENLKVVLDERGRPAATAPVLAKEIGLNRYERLRDFDDSAAERYRERTDAFWAEVRAAWRDVARRHPRFTLRAAPDQGQLFTPLFARAEQLADGAAFDPAADRAFVRDTVRGYLADGAAPPAAGY
ncbi:MAG TPA: DUF6607 family protein [Candidatus Binatia bacterium]|nr:DUF6607 family protein [Candidatus Binatia bacterium]